MEIIWHPIYTKAKAAKAKTANWSTYQVSAFIKIKLLKDNTVLTAREQRFKGKLNKGL